MTPFLKKDRKKHKKTEKFVDYDSKKRKLEK